MNHQFRRRRQFIKLASGLLATPFASLAGGSSFAADTKPPLRMLTIMDNYGLPIATRREIWISSTAGDYALTADDLGTTLAPLKAYMDNMLVVDGINADSVTETGDARDHNQLNTHALCGSRRLSGTGGAGAMTLHPSLDVHIGDYLNNGYGIGRAYSHLYFTNQSHGGSATYCYDKLGNQIRSIAGANNIATTLFSDNIDVANLQFQSQTQQFVLDLVSKKLQELRGELINANASTVMDSYESSVDDLAAQLQVGSNNVCELPSDIDSYPGASEVSSPDTTPYIFESIYQAFSCDLASSLTYGIGNELGNNFTHGSLYNEEKHADDELRVSLETRLHGVSHRTHDIANKTHELVRIHQVEELAKVLDKLSNTPDTDGSSMLDNTVVFFTSSMSRNPHKTHDFPYLLIAGRNTNLKGGFHYDCAGSTNNDLLTTIAQGMGLPDDNFGGHDADGVYLDVLNNGPITKMLNS